MKNTTITRLGFTLALALSTACGEDAPRPGAQGSSVGGEGSGSNGGGSGSTNSAPTCLETQCGSQLDACGRGCVALSNCLSNCETDACGDACIGNASAADREQLVAVLRCYDDRCQAPRPAPEPSGTPPCEDLSALLPTTLWSGFFCGDGTTGGSCPRGEDKTLFTYRFNRDGTMQVDTIRESSGRISSGGSAGLWKAECGQIVGSDCSGAGSQALALERSGTGIRLGTLQLEPFDADFVQFDYACR